MRLIPLPLPSHHAFYYTVGEFYCVFEIRKLVTCEWFCPMKQMKIHLFGMINLIWLYLVEYYIE